MTPAGLPHSDICGSKLASSSPQRFAGCCVLHRLSVPRHPPCALCNLPNSSCDRLILYRALYVIGLRRFIIMTRLRVTTHDTYCMAAHAMTSRTFRIPEIRHHRWCLLPAYSRTHTNHSGAGPFQSASEFSPGTRNIDSRRVPLACSSWRKESARPYGKPHVLSKNDGHFHDLCSNVQVVRMSEWTQAGSNR